VSKGSRLINPSFCIHPCYKSGKSFGTHPFRNGNTAISQLFFFSLTSSHRFFFLKTHHIVFFVVVNLALGKHLSIMYRLLFLSVSVWLCSKLLIVSRWWMVNSKCGECRPLMLPLRWLQSNFEFRTYSLLVSD